MRSAKQSFENRRSQTGVWERGATQPTDCNPWASLRRLEVLVLAADGLLRGFFLGDEVLPVRADRLEEGVDTVGGAFRQQLHAPVRQVLDEASQGIVLGDAF